MMKEENNTVKLDTFRNIKAPSPMRKPTIRCRNLVTAWRFASSIARDFIIALLIGRGFLVPPRARTEQHHSNTALSMAGYLAAFLIILECFELLLAAYFAILSLRFLISYFY